MTNQSQTNWNNYTEYDSLNITLPFKSIICGTSNEYNFITSQLLISRIGIWDTITILSTRPSLFTNGIDYLREHNKLKKTCEYTILTDPPGTESIYKIDHTLNNLFIIDMPISSHGFIEYYNWVQQLGVSFICISDTIKSIHPLIEIRANYLFITPFVSNDDIKTISYNHHLTKEVIAYGIVKLATSEQNIIDRNSTLLIDTNPNTNRQYQTFY